jgi:hypothetical protein
VIRDTTDKRRPISIEFVISFAIVVFFTVPSSTEFGLRSIHPLFLGQDSMANYLKVVLGLLGYATTYGKLTSA